MAWPDEVQYAKVRNDYYNVNSYGADPTGVADSTAAFQAASDAANAAGGGTVFLPSTGLYKIISSVTMSNLVSFYGAKGSRITIGTGGTFITDALFLVNTTNGTTWVDDYPGLPGPVYEGLNVINNNFATVTCGVIKTGSSIHVRNFNTWYMHYFCKTIASYLDQVKIERGVLHASKGALYQISLTSLGDGFSVDQVHCADDAAAINLLSTGYCFGGSINNCINGNYLITQSNNISINNLHNELGQIVSDNSVLTVNDSYFYELGIPAIKTTDTSSVRRGSLSVNNCSFIFMRGGTGTAASTHQIEITNNVNLYVNNCHKMFTINGALDTQERMGIIVGDSGGPLAGWKNTAPMLSYKGIVSYAKVFSMNSATITSGSGSLSSLSGAVKSLTTGPTWQAAATTYYYNGARIYDLGRMIGKLDAAAEQSIAMTLTDYTVRLSHSSSVLPHGGFYRLYRGTATNSYDKYVDIPLSTVSLLYDDGVAVNGFAWVSRTAGARDAVQDCGPYGIEWKNSICNLWGTAAPTVGTWVVGDTVLNSSFAALAPHGWICSVAGTPGTWVAMGNRA